MLLFTRTQSVDLADFMIPYYKNEAEYYNPLFRGRKHRVREIPLGKRHSHDRTLEQQRQQP